MTEYLFMFRLFLLLLQVPTVPPSAVPSCAPSVKPSTASLSTLPTANPSTMPSVAAPSGTYSAVTDSILCGKGIYFIFLTA